jgi:hypothetical protein
MNSADVWTLAVAFAVVMCFLEVIRERLKRIEEKIDKLGK